MKNSLIKSKGGAGGGWRKGKLAGAAVCASVTRGECGVIDLTITISIYHTANLLMTVLPLNNIMKGGQLHLVFTGELLVICKRMFDTLDRC